VAAGIFAALFVGVLAVPFDGKSLVDFGPLLKGGGSVEDEFDRALMGRWLQAKAYRSFKEHFPADYEALRAKAIAADQAGQSQAEVERVAFDHMRGFIVRNETPAG